MSATLAQRSRVDQRERAERRHVLRAVDQREPLLGLELDRREARAARSASRAGHRARRRRSASPSPISTSARCASGARSPEAPTEPCAGITRVHAGVEHLDAARSTISARTPE